MLLGTVSSLTALEEIYAAAVPIEVVNVDFLCLHVVLERESGVGARGERLGRASTIDKLETDESLPL